MYYVFVALTIMFIKKEENSLCWRDSELREVRKCAVVWLAVSSPAPAGSGRPGNDKGPDRPAHQSSHAGARTPTESRPARTTRSSSKKQEEGKTEHRRRIQTRGSERRVGTYKVNTSFQELSYLMSVLKSHFSVVACFRSQTMYCNSYILDFWCVLSFFRTLLVSFSFQLACLSNPSKRRGEGIVSLQHEIVVIRSREK